MRVDSGTFDEVPGFIVLAVEVRLGVEPARVHAAEHRRHLRKDTVMPFPPRRDRTPLPIPGDSYPEPRAIPDEVDPATGETADDALEDMREVGEYLFPAEDATPRAVAWSTHPTQDSTQEAEWEQPLLAPEETPVHADMPDAYREEAFSEFGVDRIVGAEYFEDEADDLNDAEAAIIQRLALPDDPHPQTEEPDITDLDTVLSDEETTRGTGAAR